jgi:hypothetical protein
MMEDDTAFERLILEALRSGLRPGAISDTWRIDVPRHLQGSGVASRYECATFRRSVATRYPAAEIEFVHRLHPLSRAIGVHAFAQLTLEPARNNLASRVAVCRHTAAAARPFALFTFLERQSHPAGIVFGIAVDAKGEVLNQRTAETVLLDENLVPGEVAWKECERAFSSGFGKLQSAAVEAARAHLHEGLKQLRAERAKIASVLREEAGLYKVDRLAEIDEEEQTERAGTREQMQLFRETATNWQARRAAVETNYTRRLTDIEHFTELPEPPEAQALGVLLVFPLA